MGGTAALAGDARAGGRGRAALAAGRRRQPAGHPGRGRRRHVHHGTGAAALPVRSGVGLPPDRAGRGAGESVGAGGGGCGGGVGCRPTTSAQSRPDRFRADSCPPTCQVFHGPLARPALAGATGLERALLLPPPLRRHVRGAVRAAGGVADGADGCRTSADRSLARSPVGPDVGAGAGGVEPVGSAAILLRAGHGQARHARRGPPPGGGRRAGRSHPHPRHRLVAALRISRPHAGAHAPAGQVTRRDPCDPDRPARLRRRGAVRGVGARLRRRLPRRHARLGRAAAVRVGPTRLPGGRDAL